MQKPYYLLTLAVAMLTGTTIQAQTTKGTRILGLSAGNIDYQKRDSYTRFSARLFPSVGTFVSDKVALGVSLPIGYSFVKYSNFGGREKQRSLEIGVLPWLRYYLPSTSPHRFFGELSAGGVLNSSRVKPVGFAAISNNDVRFLGNVGLGYSYFLTPNVGLEAVLAYNVIGGTSESFGGGTLGLNLGFRVYLPKGGAATVPAE